jgi:dihydrofolate reductase
MTLMTRVPTDPHITGNQATGRDTAMRKIVAGLFISLDGVVEAPEQWTYAYANPEIDQEVQSQFARSDTLLVGRTTYQTFAASFAGQTGGFADIMNGTPKIVVSQTLKSADWENSVLVTGNVVEQLTTLKEQPGKDIAISGSPTLVRSLLRDGLLDELRLIIFPIVLGRGLRMCPESDDRISLKLESSTATSTGVVISRNEPA